MHVLKTREQEEFESRNGHHVRLKVFSSIRKKQRRSVSDLNIILLVIGPAVSGT